MSEDPTLIAYRAMLDVPRDLVRYLAGLLRAERRRRGTRHGSRALTCGKQALFVLVWFRKREDICLLGRGSGSAGRPPTATTARAYECWPPRPRT